MRIHVLSLAHTTTKRNEWPFCAYTNKTIRLCDMLYDTGHEVYLYAGEDNDARCTEHVPIVSRQEQATWWPDRKTVSFNDFDINSPGWSTFNTRCIEAVRERAQHGDVVAVTMGGSHQPVTDALAAGPAEASLRDHPGGLNLKVVETGIGYSNVYAPFRVYESWAWRNYVTGREHMRSLIHEMDFTDDARFYDTVIPNAYDPDEFTLGDGSGDYALFIGRCFHRKGISIAADAAARAGIPLVVAGPGVAESKPGYIRCDDGTELTGDVSYFGIAYPTDRDKLMGEARCLLAPTIYLEPFGGVSVEAQFTGTPVITSDWGGFPENVEDCVGGFLCNTLSDFSDAIQNVGGLLCSREDRRANAEMKWSTGIVKNQYNDYLARLQSLDSGGWYA